MLMIFPIIEEAGGGRATYHLRYFYGGYGGHKNTGQQTREKKKKIFS